jgi:endonuclease YncB( thermonuclease family)
MNVVSVGASLLVGLFGVSGWGILSQHPVPDKALVTGSLARVIDGDTVHITEGATGYRVRLACIDAPEKNHLPYGAAATRALKAIAGKQVTVKILDKPDRYGREIGELYTSKGVNVNLEMVRQGFAFVYPKYLDTCKTNKKAYLDAQVTAHDNKIGFHAIEDFIMPWDWRKK